VKEPGSHQHSTPIERAVREWLLIIGFPSNQESDSETAFGEMGSEVRERDFWGVKRDSTQDNREADYSAFPKYRQ
jgi:hypothetical protein